MAREQLPVQLACRVLHVAESGYYAWRNRPPSNRLVKHAWLTEAIVGIHAASRGTYGSRRVHAELGLGLSIHVSHATGSVKPSDSTPPNSGHSRVSTEPGTVQPAHRQSSGPSLADGCVVRRLIAVLRPPPTPTRLAPTSRGSPGYRMRSFRQHLSAGRRAGEGLPSSRCHRRNVPCPIRRGVPHGCISRIFAASMAFALISGARHSLSPPRKADL
ncbi:hypothetical protein QF037_000037 [Streptomyces canus]|uniref:IS3 family transposase n=1 Tax=Streptomyces canus TaxID=58343 RepID=UPI002785E8BB|nr:hypothetical protein [Streptomyces canus]